MAQTCQTMPGQAMRPTQTTLLCSIQLSIHLQHGHISDHFTPTHRCRLVGAEYRLNGMMGGGTWTSMSDTFTAITDKRYIPSHLARLIVLLLHPFECTSKWPARVSTWAGFFLAPFVAAINKNRKQNASCQGRKVDRTVSDVISTLRTRIF